MKKISIVSSIASSSDTNLRLWKSVLTNKGFDVSTITCKALANYDDNNIDLPNARMLLPTNNLLQTLDAITQRAHNCILIFKWLIKIKPELVISSEPDGVLVAIIYKLLFNKKVIFYIREVFSDRFNSLVSFIKLPLKLILYVFLKFVTHFSDDLVHVSRARQKYYRFLPKEGIVVSNYPKLDRFCSKEIDGTDSLPIVIVHAGPLRSNYNSDQLINYLYELKEYPIVLKVLGGIVGSFSNQDVIDRLVEQDKLIIKPYLNSNEIEHELLTSDIGIVFFLDNSVTTNLAVPLKLFEYFAVGLPVVAPNVGTIKQIITKWNNGVLFDPSDANSFKNGILLLTEDLDYRKIIGKNGKNSFLKEYNWETEEDKLTKLLVGILNVNSS